MVLIQVSQLPDPAVTITDFYFTIFQLLGYYMVPGSCIYSIKHTVCITFVSFFTSQSTIFQSSWVEPAADKVSCLRTQYGDSAGGLEQANAVNVCKTFLIILYHYLKQCRPRSNGFW